MPDQYPLYAPLDPQGRFRFSSVRQKRNDVRITDSDKKYGGLAVKKVFLSLLGDETLPVEDADWASVHAGWIVQNPDDTYWLDTLSQKEADTRAWWGDKERAAKREAIGFKVVRVQLAVA